MEAKTTHARLCDRDWWLDHVLASLAPKSRASSPIRLAICLEGMAAGCPSDTADVDCESHLALDTMSYGWWKFIHLAGVVGFVAAHGTSMAATVLMRRIREPQQISGILQLSAATVSAFYLSTLVLLVGGIGAGVQGQWFDQGWIWVSLGLLIAVGVLMFPMARGHFRRIRMVLELMDSGTAVSKDDFTRVLNSGSPILTAGTGFVSILFIVYLMVLKPF